MAPNLLLCPVVLLLHVPATAVGVRIMDQDTAKGPFEIGRLWSELTILRGVLIVSSILFLVLAFCPP